jgi:hypothetical protein
MEQSAEEQDDHTRKMPYNTNTDMTAMWQL